jgi:hypothetical protein
MSVFLANPNNRYDLSALEPYGDLEFITKDYLNPFNTEDCINSLRAGLERFNPEKDYLCMTGNLQVIAFMLMIATQMYPTLRILMFDSVNSNYRERVIINE